MPNLESTLAGTTIAAFIALHDPDTIFAMSADPGGVTADGRTSAENLHDLAQLIYCSPVPLKKLLQTGFETSI